MHKVAVVILNYNGKNHLEKFLPSVIKYTENAEIIIADNCSTDDSVNFLINSYPRIRIISLTTNEGFSQGYNSALQKVNADIYVLLNSDVEVTAGWMEPILNLMVQNEIAACQPKILSYKEKHKFEYAGAGGGYIDTLGYPFCRGRIFETVEEDNNQYDDVKQVFWASGACMFIKANIFHELGGFDPYFFAHMEEIDLWWRINNAGYKVFYNGKSTVYHLGGGTLPKGNPRKTFLNFRNSLFTLLKNINTKDLYWKLFLRMILDGVAALKFLFFDTKEDFIALWKSHIDFYRHFWKYHALRKKINKNIKNYNSEIIYSGFIVFDYYIRNKKKYKNLKIS
jgi:GT2 family glycosyltransferase